MYIPRLFQSNHLKILTDEEVKDFVVINFSEYFKFDGEKLYSKLNEEENLTKVAESRYIFLTIPDKVEMHAKMMQSSSSNKCVHCPIILRF